MVALTFKCLFVLYFSKWRVSQFKFFIIKIIYLKQLKKKRLNILKQNINFQLVFFLNIVKLAFLSSRSGKPLLMYWRIWFTKYFRFNYRFLNFKFLKKIGLVSMDQDSLSYAWALIFKAREKKNLFMLFSELRNFSLGKKSFWYRFKKLFHRKRFYDQRQRYLLRNRYYYHLKVLKSKKKSVFEINHYVIKFFKRKNNLFVNLSTITGDVLFFLTGGRFTHGKKKTSTLTSKHLARILCRMIIRYFNLLEEQKFRDFFFKRFFFTFEFNMLLHTPFIKTFFNIFRQFELPILRLIDTIKVPHSLGVKKKKVRRV